ncbi:MAG: hypothetical protein C0614_04195 [Desulfuromonas sp.]|nr:MAG: hypothetical protein C0614_04195 [Desulfuromonas sp.]
MPRRKSSNNKNFSNSPFGCLKRLPAAAKGAGQKPNPQADQREAQELFEGDDTVCFASEMDFLEVRPLPGRECEMSGAGLEVPVARESRQGPEDRELFLEAAGTMDTLFRDEYPEDEPDASRERSQGRRLRQLARGRLQPQAELDLHGLKVVEASSKARFFLEDAVHQGFHCVLLITGKGLHSDDGPVLRLAMERLLEERRDLVVEWGSAPRRLGGDGALAVFLRNKS